MKRFSILILCFLVSFSLLSQTKTEIRSNQLPKSVSDFLSKAMTGYSIDKAFKVVEKGVQSYFVVVKKGELSSSLSFDKDGNFLKKVDAEVKGAPTKPKEPAKTLPKSPPKSN